MNTGFENSARGNDSSGREILPRQAALIGGAAYLGVFILATFANGFSLGKIVVRGDAAATAANILAHGDLFRYGLAAWMAVIACDALAAWALYFVFKPVDKGLSLLAAWFRLIFAAIFAYSFVPDFSVLDLFSGREYLTAFNDGQLQAQAMLLLEAHEHGMHISYVFFGLHIFLLGYLILKSGRMPRSLGGILILASIGYLIDSFGNFISPAYAASKAGFIVFVAVPAVVSELWLTFWLLLKGGMERPARGSIPE